jgi:hypothetical protein
MAKKSSSFRWVTLAVTVVLFFAIAAEKGYADDPETRPVGEGPILNSDCEAPLVSKNYGNRCSQECREARDCGWGQVCEKDKISGRYGVCKPAPPPPPAPGGFTGRVERALGEGVPCSIEVWRVAEGTHAGVVHCNATSGGFVKEDLPVGLYLLRVTAGAGLTQSTRDFYAPVNPGTTTYLGALTVPISGPIVNPSRPGFPGGDILREISPDSSKPARIPPGGGQPPIK